MEKTLQHTPMRAHSFWPALAIALLVLSALSAGLLMSYGELAGALVLLARHALRLAPPALWLGAALAAALWVVVMQFVWRKL